MLLVKASSSCDACLEPFHLKGESSPTVRVPCAIDCGHIFCAICIATSTRLTCPLCRSYFNPGAVRRLDVHVAPQTPDIRSARVGRPDNNSATSPKEVLKDRIISIVRNGADESHYQVVVQETCAWLKEQTSEEHWDLRALYLLLTNYYHHMHKDEEGVTDSLHEKIKLYQDALRMVEKCQREIAELKRIIEDLQNRIVSKEVQWTVREKQLTTKYDEAIEEITNLRKQRIALPIVEDECPIDPPAPVKPFVNHFSPLPVHRPLTPMPSTINAAIPFVKNITDSVEDEHHYFRPRPQSSEDGDQTPVEYPSSLMVTPVSKHAVISAAIARFYDTAASETGASPPYSTPAACDNRRHEKEKENLQELSRDNSSCSTRRISSSRIRALQEKRVPESGDGAERSRCTRQQLLNASLANAPTPQSSPASIHTRPPHPTPPPPPPPPTRRLTDISRPNTAAKEIERERQRRRHPSNQNRSSETPATYAASTPPSLPPQVHTQRMAQARPRVQSLKDTTKAHGAEDRTRRRSVYSERHLASRTATERPPSMGKP